MKDIKTLIAVKYLDSYNSKRYRSTHNIERLKDAIKGANMSEKYGSAHNNEIQTHFFSSGRYKNTHASNKYTSFTAFTVVKM